MRKAGIKTRSRLILVEGLPGSGKYTVKHMNPIVVYADQRDLDFSFKKAVNERPPEWANGFTDYDLKQGLFARWREDLPMRAKNSPSLEQRKLR